MTHTTQCTVRNRKVTLASHLMYCNNSRGNLNSTINVLPQIESLVSLTIEYIATTREVNVTQHTIYCDKSRSDSRFPFNVLRQLNR